jgi:hypothetical protein
MQAMDEADVTVEAREEGGVPHYAIKIALPCFEFNVSIPQADIGRLRQAEATDWAVGSLRLGTSAGAPVFWCGADGGALCVLIGLDDETWDIALTLPAGIVPTIFEALP